MKQSGYQTSTGFLEENPYTFYLDNAKKAIDLMIVKQRDSSTSKSTSKFEKNTTNNSYES